ncbi:MAG: hypothetical protein QM784_00740 [Polyangiaceae bacterium]
MARSFAFFAVVSFVVACSGCSSSGSADVPNGPDDFAIAKVEAVETGSSATEDGQSLVLGCSGIVLVSLRPKLDDENRLGDFLLAPPGSCGSTVDCGWVEVDVNRSPGGELLDEDARGSSAELPLRVDIPAGKRTGEVTFVAHLLDADAQEVLVPDTKGRLEAELTVKLSESCVPSTGTN